jgi:hypothetical protein
MFKASRRTREGTTPSDAFLDVARRIGDCGFGSAVASAKLSISVGIQPLVQPDGSI